MFFINILFIQLCLSNWFWLKCLAGLNVSGLDAVHGDVIFRKHFAGIFIRCQPCIYCSSFYETTVISLIVSKTISCYDWLSTKASLSEIILMKITASSTNVFTWYICIFCRSFNNCNSVFYNDITVAFNNIYIIMIMIISFTLMPVRYLFMIIIYNIFKITLLLQLLITYFFNFLFCV